MRPEAAHLDKVELREHTNMPNKVIGALVTVVGATLVL
jgi:hypothetical protein